MTRKTAAVLALVRALLWVAGAATSAAQTTERVSVSSAGEQGNFDSFARPSWSVLANGRYVVFSSRASNLVSGDTNGEGDVFVHDRQTGITERVSVDSAGGEGNGDSGYASISAHGRYVAFESSATNLVSGDTNSFFDVFVRGALGCLFCDDFETGDTSAWSSTVP